MINNNIFFFGGKELIIDNENFYTNNIVISENNKSQTLFNNNIDDYINNKYNIEKRILYYNYIYKKLLHISKNKCLENKKFDNKYSGYTIADKINLIKVIGTESSYGVIYITKIKNVIGTYPIV